MTILFFSPRFSPDIGGVEKHVQKISEVFLKDGHTIIVVTEESKYEETNDIHMVSPKWQVLRLVNKLLNTNKLTTKSESFPAVVLKKKSHVTHSHLAFQTPNITIYRMPKFRPGKSKKLKIWMWLWTNRQLMQQADIIHCHDVFFWYIPFRFIYPKNPIYTTFHGYEGYPIRKKATLIRKISEKMSWGNICVGEFINKWYGTKASFVVYGGIEKQVESRVIQKKNKSKRIKFLLLGRLADDIGISMYLDALAKLHEKKIAYELEVVGDGPLRKSVEYYGKVYGFVEDVGTYIKRADIVFASSYLSILEALSFGKNVIAVYDNPLKEDYLKMSPFKEWIHISRSSTDIVDFIEKYSMTHNSQESRVKAKLWANDQTWERVAEVYYKLWEKNKIDRK